MKNSRLLKWNLACKNSVHLTQALNFLAEKVGFKNSPLFGENSSLEISPLLDENSNVKNSSFKGEFIFLKFKFTRIKNDSKH